MYGRQWKTNSARGVYYNGVGEDRIPEICDVEFSDDRALKQETYNYDT